MASDDAGVSSAAGAGGGASAAALALAWFACRNRHANRPEANERMKKGIIGMPGSTPTPNAQADTTPSATG
ncbi:hypothetical protein D3C83_267800 [compost metagenome]